MQHVKWVALCSVLLVGAVGEARGADGSISTTNATIASGAAPTQGVVTIDASAPEAEAPALPALTPLGDIGTMTGALAAFPGGGTGAEGAFHATATQTLAGGTFHFTSYLVDSGVTVTYSGPVTILATGDVTVRGKVVTTASDAPITIRCAGEFLVDGASAAIATSAAISPVTIHAGRSVGTGADDGISAAIGNVSVTAYGMVAGTGDIDVTGGFIEDGAGPGVGQGAVTLRAAGSIHVTAGARVGSVDDPLLLQAFGGDVTVSDGSYLNARDERLTVEASGDVRVSGSSYVNTQNGAMVVSAFGGDVTADSTGGAAYFNTREGDLTLRASGGLSFKNGGSSASSLTGKVTLLAFDGDVGFDHAESLLNTAGSAEVRAAADVRCAGALRTGGDLLVEALGGSLSFTGDGSVRVTGDGHVDLRAVTLIEVLQGPDGSASIETNFGAGDIRLSAGGGGIDLDIRVVDCEAGDITLLTTGPIALRTTTEEDTPRALAGGAISMISATGGIRVAGADVTTRNQSGVTSSGDILLESFGGANGAIDADGATIRSGTSTAASGSVTLRVHGSSAVPVTRSYFLPSVVKTKLNGAGKDTLVAAGFFDDGGATVSYGSPVTITVAGFSRTFDLTPNKKGTVFGFKGPDLILSVRPDRVVEQGVQGSSRGKFRLRIADTTLAGLVPTEGEVDFHLSASGLSDAVGIVVVEGGKYKLGRRRGTLSAPAFLPKTVKASVGDTKPDKLLLIGGFAATADAPAALGTVRVGVGETFSLEIPGDQFTRKGDVWTFRQKADGTLVSVAIDFVREQVTVRTKGVEVGDLAGATTDIVFDSGAGTPAVATTVVLSQPKPSLRVY